MFSASYFFTISYKEIWDEDAQNWSSTNSKEIKYENFWHLPDKVPPGGGLVGITVDVLITSPLVDCVVCASVWVVQLVVVGFVGGGVGRTVGRSVGLESPSHRAFAGQSQIFWTLKYILKKKEKRKDGKI